MAVYQCFLEYVRRLNESAYIIFLKENKLLTCNNAYSNNLKQCY